MRCRYDMIWYVTICHQLFNCDLWFGSWFSKVLNMVLSSVLGPQFRYYVWDGLNPQASTGTVGQYRPFFTAGLLRDLEVSPLPSLIETVILLLLDPRIHQGSSQIIQNHLEGHFKDLRRLPYLHGGNMWKSLETSFLLKLLLKLLWKPSVTSQGRSHLESRLVRSFNQQRGWRAGAMGRSSVQSCWTQNRSDQYRSNLAHPGFKTKRQMMDVHPTIQNGPMGFKHFQTTFWIILDHFGIVERGYRIFRGFSCKPRPKLCLETG